MVCLKYDGEITIAVGKSRKEKNWKNKDIMWSELVEKLSNTTRTAESSNEYASSTKSRQAEIKDIGGFVGGYLAQGIRKADSVINRSVITLDIDFAKDCKGIIDNFDLLFGSAVVVYSTHSHTPSKPKLRLVIPLSRQVYPDEYEAISRRIAGDLGINDFDDTTFQPSRLMYFPSTSRDGEYIFQKIDAPFIDVDQVLNTYYDWKDSSSWPVSDRVNKIIERSIKKQGDPLEKPGLIGAFCRCYDIHEAIDLFLSEEYEPCVKNNRYTYKQGSTSAGLITYQDKFAYSHHGTDPCSNKLCNAFDLVRIHKFGLKDEDVKEDTPSNRLPSYKAMVDFVSKDKKVRGQLGKEKFESACEDFQDDKNKEVDTSWMENLDVDSKGRIRSTIKNVRLIVLNDIRLKGAAVYDDFAKKEVQLKDLPWRKLDKHNPYLKDSDEGEIRGYFEECYGITGVNKIKDGWQSAMLKNAIHPIKDYFNTLKWDEEKRLETLFIDYLGVENSEYTRTVTKKALVACVARIFKPGCKYDYVLTLVGPQGAGKSTLIKKLGGKWCVEGIDLANINKDTYDMLQGAWLVEMGELNGLKKAEINNVKQFITKTTDRFRAAYARKTEDYPRQCVFFGTTNEKNFLKDDTGDRRWWVLDLNIEAATKNIFKDLTAYEIDQIWAEALELYHKGETLFLSKELEEIARQVQKDHKATDDRKGLIEDYLNTPVPENWYERDTYERINYIRDKDELDGKGTILRDRVCILEVWIECLGGQKKDLDRRKSMELHSVLKSIDGWEAYEKSGGVMKIKGYGRQRVYVRKE